MVPSCADLCDKFLVEPVDSVVPKEKRFVQVAEPVFKDFGGRAKFNGPIYTVQIFNSNPAVRTALSQPGNGRVLVIDGKGSVICGVVGDQLAQLGIDNGWAGVVVNAAVRDTAILKQLDFGVRALASNPRKSSKRDPGVADVTVHFAGVEFKPGYWLYADEDGIIVAPEKLHGDAPSSSL
jgi:regulator of ribonuclease activity A